MWSMPGIGRSPDDDSSPRTLSQTVDHSMKVQELLKEASMQVDSAVRAPKGRGRS